MKLFLKISFLLLITFNFFGSYAGKVVKTVNNIEVRQTSNIHQDINCPQVPESLSVFKRFRHGIDETFVSINKYSDRVYINIDLSLNDVYFYQSWIKYFFISCQAMPGYETHLSSLPLRSPPFSC